MAASSLLSVLSPRSQLAALLLLVLLLAVGAGANYDSKAVSALCSKTTDMASCLKVFPTLPDTAIANASDSLKLYRVLSEYCMSKIDEAKSFAEAMIYRKKGYEGVISQTDIESEPAPPHISSKCLASCNESIGVVYSILLCGRTYPEDKPPIIHQNLTALFRGGHPPPLCETGCPDSSSSNSETILATKFHYIWTLLHLMDAILQHFFSGLTPA
uniref:Pectinesterase inhibitor domain-containing protein n=1 Tax=Leersia perrieri TaxID=77586 RepID=A0A0D9V8Z1_9ORYZ